jgi:hypothetical protein
MNLIRFMVVLFLVSLFFGCANKSVAVSNKNKSKSVDFENIMVPEIKPSPLAIKILKKYKGDILTPDNLKRLSLLNNPIGWSFKLTVEGDNNLKHKVFTLASIENEEYFFDYGSFDGGKNSAIAKYKWSKGYMYYLKKNTVPMKYASQGEEKCKFQLGKCSFKNYKNRTVYVYTEFREGMWIRNMPSTGGSRKLYIDVYDSKGFPIYHMFKSLRTGGSHELRRIEKI